VKISQDCNTTIFIFAVYVASLSLTPSVKYSVFYIIVSTNQLPIGLICFKSATLLVTIFNFTVFATAVCSFTQYNFEIVYIMLHGFCCLHAFVFYYIDLLMEQ